MYLFALYNIAKKFVLQREKCQNMGYGYTCPWPHIYLRDILSLVRWLRQQMVTNCPSLKCNSIDLIANYCSPNKFRKYFCKNLVSITTFGAVFFTKISANAALRTNIDAIFALSLNCVYD